jgi:hypothetical protein
MIRHTFFSKALPYVVPVLPLPVPVVEPSFGALLVTEIDLPQVDSTRRCGARPGAVDMPAVATPANHETLIAARALAVQQQNVHVAPAWTTSRWTPIRHCGRDRGLGGLLERLVSVPATYA